MVFAYHMCVLLFCICCEKITYFSVFLINETAIKRNFLSWFLRTTHLHLNKGVLRIYVTSQYSFSSNICQDFLKQQN